MDVHVGLTVEILDFVDTLFQFPIFEDGGVGRVQGHSWEGKCDNATNTSKSRR